MQASLQLDYILSYLYELSFLNRHLLPGLSMGVKRIVRQPRPAATCAMLGKCHKYGMPSSHAQVMSFALSTAVLTHLHRRKNRKAKLEAPLSEAVEILELLILAAATAIVSFARVYLGYHSAGQVFAGVLFGSTFGWAWFLFLAVAQEAGLGGVVQKVCAPMITLKNRWRESRIHTLDVSDKKNL